MEIPFSEMNALLIAGFTFSLALLGFIFIAFCIATRKINTSPWNYFVYILFILSISGVLTIWDIAN
jgi:hypothetical protein